MWRRLGVLVLLFAVGCEDDAKPALVVDLKTDLVPVDEFVAVRTEVSKERFVFGITSGRRVDEVVMRGADYLAGRRIAEIDELSSGAHFVRVSALGPGGEVIVDRITAVTLREGTVTLTVLLTRDCRGVSCPPADGASNLTACLGGRCVDPACSPENPSACGDPLCTLDGDCEDLGTCVNQRCIDGVCLSAPDDAECAAAERCDPDLGCVLRDGADAGPAIEEDAGSDAGTCAPAETSCSDGMDEDCDSATDCDDTECDDRPCGPDGLVCIGGGCVCPGGAAEVECNDAMDDDCDGLGDCADTDCEGLVCGLLGEVCLSGACTCAGGTNETDCGNVADDDCDGMRDCEDPDCDTRACGTSGETCVARACTCTGGSSEMACDDGVDNDCDGNPDCADPDCDTRLCGAVTFGTYGACGYTGTCDESASQSRPVTTPTCTAGACMPVMSTETRACTRDTDGVMCGSTTFTAWSCGGFANACDETGTETRTRNERNCVAGACTTQGFTERRGCSRSVPDGTSCGGTYLRCCRGGCRDLNDDATDCGVCGINCGSGMVCAATGTGGYACRGCSSNAQCQAIYGGAATCYNVASPPAWCNCQMSSDCPGTAVCAEPSGTNYCHY